MSAAEPSPVTHDPANSRFAIALADGVAVLDYRRLDEQTLDYYHTFVPRALRGRGLASQLAEHALRYAADNGLSVVPSCPFVKAYVERHPEFRAAVR